MAKKVGFTSAQVAAAKLKIELAEVDGKQVDPRIVAIANGGAASRTMPPDGIRARGALATRITITPAQVAAARLKTELAEADGRQVEPGIVAIANAKPVR